MSFRGLKLVQLFPAVHRTAMRKKKAIADISTVAFAQGFATNT